MDLSIQMAVFPQQTLQGLVIPVVFVANAQVPDEKVWLHLSVRLVHVDSRIVTVNLTS